jgi:hypothetical protein
MPAAVENFTGCDSISTDPKALVTVFSVNQTRSFNGFIIFEKKDQ